MADISATAASVRPLNGTIIRRGAAGGSGSCGDLVYLNGTSGWQKADSDASGSTKGRGVVVAVNGQPGATSFASGDALDIVVHGPVTGYSGMTPGAEVFSSATAGAVADAAGTYAWVVGWAQAADVLFVDPIGNTTGTVAASDLSSTLKTGFILLPLTQAREIATNDIINTAGDAGALSSNTTPKLYRENGATDKKLLVEWAASNSDEIVWDFSYPPDLDDTAAIVVNLLFVMSGATDTPTVAVSYFEGVGDTNAGGNTAALSNSLAKKTVTIAAGDVGAYPTGASIGIVPGAHTTDKVQLLGAWIEYTRK